MVITAHVEIIRAAKTTRGRKIIATTACAAVSLSLRAAITNQAIRIAETQTTLERIRAGTYFAKYEIVRATAYTLIAE